MMIVVVMMMMLMCTIFVNIALSLMICFSQKLILNLPTMVCTSISFQLMMTLWQKLTHQ